ncbi:MAG: class I SAM-dependent methyltransferase [Anaerolineae bacterium]|nr:class I SAM-dependent methyltransferase [Anaerolineae bacterium]
MYDAFSDDYDRFVNWEARLAFEMPFIETQLQMLDVAPQGARRVLDAACGSGMHAIALARRGYMVCGADLSAAMIARARQNAAAQLPDPRAVQFAVAGFGSLARAFAAMLPFDAVLCLGNSLPHALTPQALAETLADFAACLRPGGLLLVQNRNFDAVLAERQRWMEPQAYQEGDREWIYLRFYDFAESEPTIQFNIITLERQANSGWQQRVSTTPLYPLRKDALEAALGAAGFGAARWYGSLNGAPFDAHSSGNMVAAARKNG